ncbi:hypothetical protein Taro_018393 [Colocasia esculenta]|uniref:Legume lectin domain-containing protein n=1 Tax=Colocasia esculenta TaxID=4460 RepID=A0A843V2B1_COLES|nr:hypothetical protein [Colocasia esculenta]
MQPTTFMLLLVVVIMFMYFSRPVQPLSFDYPNFSSKHLYITFQGNASVGGGGVINLTPTQIDGNNQYLTSRVNPFHLWDNITTGNSILSDFTTRFSFVVRLVPGYKNYTGDGMAFFLALYGSDIPTNSSTGGRLGLFNDLHTSPLPGIIPTLAI